MRRMKVVGRIKGLAEPPSVPQSHYSGQPQQELHGTNPLAEVGAKPSKQNIVDYWKGEAAVGVGTPTVHDKAKAR